MNLKTQYTPFAMMLVQNFDVHQ